MPSARTRQIWKDRWSVMRECGVPTFTARNARTNLAKFRAALEAVGRNAEEWPHLNHHLASSRWTSHVPKTERAEWQAWAYRALKAAGLVAHRAELWSRSEVSFHYALHCISTAQTLPARPSDAPDKFVTLAKQNEEGRRSWEE